MIALYAGLAGLLFVAVGMLLFLLRRNRATGTDVKKHSQSQRDFYRQRQRELQTDFQAGLIDQNQLADLERELDRQLVSESDDSSATASNISHRGLIIGVLIVIPILAMTLYEHLAYRQDFALQELQREIVGNGMNETRWQHYQDLVADILDQRPESGEHLVMMATLFRQQGDFAGALPYYQRLEALYPNDADVLGQLAQARFLVNKRQLDDTTRSLLERALAVNPRQSTALGVLGINAFAQSQYSEALRYWQPLLSVLSPNSAEAEVITGGVAEAKRRAMAAGELRGISIAVSLDANLGSLPAGVLFVVAKSRDGNPMPVAALRIPLAEQSWPITITLSDVDVIRSGKTLTDFSELDLSAHISRAGTAISRQGDWYAEKLTVDTSKEDAEFALKIDKIKMAD
jgi:cytochrome c-type biogenesis protein CcmH